MVRLRGLPVVVAGHTLDSMQLAVGAWGSFLVVPPWWRISRGAELVRLGQLNLAFYTFLLLFPV